MVDPPGIFESGEGGQSSASDAEKGAGGVVPEDEVDAGDLGPTVSTTEAAHRLGVSNAYVQQLLAKGKLVGHRRLGARTVWRVDVASLEQLVVIRSSKRTAGSESSAGSGNLPAPGDTSRADRHIGLSAPTHSMVVRDDRSEMLELELVAARAELAELRNQVAREQMTNMRLQAENRDLVNRLTSITAAHVQVVQSLIPRPE